MSRPEFTPQISLGNILTIIGGVVAFAFAWGSVDSRLTAVQEQAASNAARIEAAQIAQQTRQDALAERVRVAETGVARQDERWTSVQSQLSRIEQSLTRLNDRLDAQ